MQEEDTAHLALEHNSGRIMKMMIVATPDGRRRYGTDNFGAMAFIRWYLSAMTSIRLSYRPWDDCGILMMGSGFKLLELQTASNNEQPWNKNDYRWNIVYRGKKNIVPFCTCRTVASAEKLRSVTPLRDALKSFSANHHETIVCCCREEMDIQNRLWRTTEPSVVNTSSPLQPPIMC